ncbi:MAG: YqaJ viral recombinase family protein [Lachnospiraceae bacterium]|nr:YqaJ viral recombinase family protein [Lachnospiraceae bacterium]MDE7202616.1 YqaJ viral recombinase family protein [Lachnospiraceae bacterium]
MYEKIPTAGMSNEEWLTLRKTGIGGSDAGSICGVNPFGSPMKVYHDKTSSGVEELDNEAVRQGHDLEDYVAQRFMEATGLKVRRSNFMYRSVENPFMIADVDRLVIGEDAGLECKTASAYNADKWKDGEIPLHYIMQCYHYMAVTGKRTWYIAAVILGQSFTYRKLIWDDGLIAQLISMEKDFWEDHVAAKVMPSPDGSKICNEVLNQYFHSARKGSTIRLEGFDDRLNRRAEIMEQIEILQKEQNSIEQEIKLYMQDNEYAASDSYKVSWSIVESTRLDSKRIREEHPEIYRDYAKQSVSRRFQIKAA